MKDQKRFWVGFNLVKGIGAVRLQALRDHFGDLSLAWQAPTDAFRSVGFSPKLIEQIVHIRSHLDLDQYMERLAHQDIQVLTWDDAVYPSRLREIEQPPPVLYMRGALTGADVWSVAVIGTRRVTAYGQRVTEEIVSFLTQNGITVVSGFARGVDAIAHQTALKAGGRTLAVLGNGVDQVYPPEHRLLAEKVCEAGALLSDYPPGTPPEGTNFPPRNRIISGLAMAVAVIEAGETSGALITAAFAADQGREVFAVPGNISAPQSRGTNKLIQQGAHPLLTGVDILEELNLTRAHEQQSLRRKMPDDEIEAQMLRVLNDEPLHIDEIVNRTNLPVERVSATLVMLELKGLVRQAGGMNYVSVREANVEYSVDQ